MQGKIRLTNKTAIALRESAKTAQKAGFVLGVVVTAVLAIAAVWLGMQWLPAVPLLIGAAVAIDALIVLYIHQTYLLLTGQAICTEAAARSIHGEKKERQRRRQAVDDLMAMQKDLRKAVEKEEREDSGAFPVLSQTRVIPVIKTESPEPKTEGHRRRKQAVFTVIESDKQVQ